jgi:hypothetical protein
VTRLGTRDANSTHNLQLPTPKESRSREWDEIVPVQLAGSGFTPHYRSALLWELGVGRWELIEVNVSDQPQIPGSERRLGSIPNVKLGEDVRHVVLDRAFGQAHPIGDFLVRSAA